MREPPKTDAPLLALRAKTFFVALAPCPHCVYDRHQSLPQVGERVLHARRHLGIHLAMHDAIVL